MFLCGHGIGTGGPLDQTCCCSAPCSRHEQRRSRWPGRRHCCVRSLPAPQRLQWTRPAMCLYLVQREREAEEKESMLVWEDQSR